MDRQTESDKSCRDQAQHMLPNPISLSPRNFLPSGVANGAFQCHFGSLYSNTPTPSPSKKFSLQIYTDLKDGPGSWKKKIFFILDYLSASEWLPMGVPVKFHGPPCVVELVLSLRLDIAELNQVEGVKLVGLKAPPEPLLGL